VQSWGNVPCTSTRKSSAPGGMNECVIVQLESNDAVLRRVFAEHKSDAGLIFSRFAIRRVSGFEKPGPIPRGTNFAIPSGQRSGELPGAYTRSKSLVVPCASRRSSESLRLEAVNGTADRRVPQPS